MTCKSISRNERKRYCRINVTHNCIRKPIGIDLAPRHSFARCGARKSSGIRTRIGHLQEVIVTTLVDAEHFLDLWFSLQQKVFRRAAAENEDSRSPFLFTAVARLHGAALGGKHDRGGLIHV